MSEEKSQKIILQNKIINESKKTFNNDIIKTTILCKNAKEFRLPPIDIFPINSQVHSYISNPKEFIDVSSLFSLLNIRFNKYDIYKTLKFCS